MNAFLKFFERRDGTELMIWSYIPSTIDLIQKYIKPDTTEEARDNIKGMFSTLASAFANLDKKLRKQDEIEMEAEMEVMKQTLARDGLLDSDFDI